MKIAIGVIAIALTACGERVQNPPAVGDDISIPQFEWRVRTAEQINGIHALNGIHVGNGRVAEGIQGVDPKGTVVVYTKAPQHVDDSVACTLGHEVMHIALGRYHKESK